ncbi:unnamed protein product [Closterium sp. NIES-53]
MFPLAKKSDVTSTLIRWLLTTEGTRGRCVTCLHSDCGGASPTSLWTGSPGVVSRFRIWGFLALVRDTSADKLSARAIPCVFLGFLNDSFDFTFYHPHLHRFLDSRDVCFDESVPCYTRCPCRGLSVPPLFSFWLPPFSDGSIERFKARCVVHGYDQRHGIDFDQTFAPVSRHTSLKILLAITAVQHLPLRQIDVKNAFLYALVDAQYLHNILLKIGFKQLPHDPGMYRRDFRCEYILLTVYVVDLLYTWSSNELLEQFEKNLVGRVDITCNHGVKQFLGLNISYSPEAIHLSAAKYAEELGKCFNIAPAPLSTPYRTPEPNHKPDNKALSPAGLHTYQQQLGCLLFASVTCRPDLSYIASQLAQYSRKPTAENLLDLQRALQFFISTPNVGLCYSTISTSSFNLIGYVDADHAADPDNRRSKTNFLFRLEPSGPVSWNSQNQEQVSLSSAEAKFIAATAPIREGLYLWELLQEAR